ncbi:MAG TPA: DUF917 family protein [Candidatus Saccharimonadia bacterium]|nr:DUF917 family protein [Candidatus Saccharimonadia bacterium]
MKITTVNIGTLLSGASLLACGGGLSFREQQRLAAGSDLKKALQKGVRLLPVAALPKNSYVVTVSEVGAADAPVMDKSGLSEALRLLEAKTHKKIVALLPGEIGQETITLDAATVAQLPVVDSDLSGCRAVPRLVDCAFVRNVKSFCMSPMVVMFADGRMEFIKKQRSLQTDEKIVRAIVPDGEIVTIVGGMVSSSIVQKYLNYGSYSLAITLGKALRAREKLQDCFPTPVLLGPTKVTVKKVQKLKLKGFNKKRVVLASALGEIELTIQNEYMACRMGTKIFRFPQMIMLLDRLGKRGLHSSEVKKGMSAILFIADAFAFWKGNE